MLKSRFCDYSDAYILVRGIITVPNTAATSKNNANKKVTLCKLCPFYRLRKWNKQCTSG